MDALRFNLLAAKEGLKWLKAAHGWLGPLLWWATLVGGLAANAALRQSPAWLPPLVGAGLVVVVYAHGAYSVARGGWPPKTQSADVVGASAGRPVVTGALNVEGNVGMVIHNHFPPPPVDPDPDPRPRPRHRHRS